MRWKVWLAFGIMAFGMGNLISSRLTPTKQTKPSLILATSFAIKTPDEKPIESSGVSGVLYDQKGKPVPFATLSLLQANTPPKQIKSDRLGSFSFEESLQNPIALVVSGAQKSTVIFPRKNVRNKIVVKTSANITGQILDEFGKPLPNAEVFLIDTKIGLEAPYANFSGYHRNVFPKSTFHTGPDGKYHLEHSREGLVSIAARAPGHPVQESQAFQVVSGSQKTVTLRLVKARKMQVRVLDKQRRPIQNAEVQFAGAENSLFTDREGNVLLQTLPSGWFHINAPGYLHVIGKQASSEEVILEKPARLSGSIPGTLPGSKVVLISKENLMHSNWSFMPPPFAKIDNQNAFEINQIPADSYEVWLLHMKQWQKIGQLSFVEGEEKKNILFSFETGVNRKDISYCTTEFLPDITSTYRQNTLWVQSVDDSSLKILEGDRILSVDGMFLSDLLLEQLGNELLSGERNTSVHLVIERPASKKVFSIEIRRTNPYQTCDTIDVSSKP